MPITLGFQENRLVSDIDSARPIPRRKDDRIGSNIGSATQPGTPVSTVPDPRGTVLTG
jgi:hypothetical protein